MYKPDGKSHVRAAFKMSYKHVDVRGLCTHTVSMFRQTVASCRHSVWTCGERTCTLSPSVAIASDRLHSSIPVSERP